MQEYKFSYTANAGLAIQTPSSMIWVDALHSKKAPTFSTLTKDKWEQIRTDPDYIGAKLQGPDAIAYSHCHIDHFTPDYVKEAVLLWPQTKIILPEKYFPDEIYVHGSFFDVPVNDVNLHFFKTHHSNKRHHFKTHYSLIIQDHGINIFMPVDSSLSDPDMYSKARDTKVDIAIVDFIWLLLEKGRDLIENVIQPEHLLVYHLPFECDDHWGHRKQTEEAAGLLKTVSDIRLMEYPFQKENIQC